MAKRSRAPRALAFDDATAAKLRERLIARSIVNPETGCWEMVADSSLPHVRMQLRDRGLVTFAHRVAFAVFVRPLEADELVLHRCDNQPCICPDHLYAGDHSQNLVDRWRAYRNGNGHAPG